MIVRYLSSLLVILSVVDLSEGFIKQKCRGTWSDWSRWKGDCKEECTGVKVRTRTCINTGLFYCGTPKCPGSRVQYDVCAGVKVDGKWSAWSIPDCHYCTQKRMRTRTCTNPEPQCGGADCAGPSVGIMSCGESQCPDLGDLVPDKYRRTKNGTKKDYRCGATVTVTCPKCHRLEGPSKLKCLPDGQWHKNLPSCTPMDGIEAQWSAFGPWSTHCRACNEVIYRTRDCRSTCGEVCQGDATERYICGSTGCSINSFINRSKYLQSSEAVVSCGASVTLSCTNSKSLVGRDTLVCGLGGWEGLLPDCVDQSCPSPPKLLNGRMMSTGITYGKFAQFLCDDEYSLKGQQYLVCLGSHWSYDFPTCVRKVGSCTALDTSDTLLVNSTSTDIGTAVRIQCMPGYALVGSSILTCNEYGSWSEDAPVCETQGCGPFPDIDNGIVVHSDFGRFVTVSCEAGYVLNGADTVRCLEDEGWDYDVPWCEENLCELPKTENGEWYRVVDNNIALLRCDRGYIARGDAEIVCGYNKTWEGLMGRCVEHLCDLLPGIAHGHISTDDTSVGTVAVVSCDRGFEVAGHWKLSCLSTGLWNYVVPECKQSDCAAFPPIENGFISSQQFSQGSVVSIVCELGYTLEGDDSATCLPTGEWSSRSPTCHLAGCIPPTIADGIVVTGIILVGTYATVVCENGFKLTGSNKIFCKEDGGIDQDESSICLPISCPVIYVDNSDVTLDDVIYRSIARVKCHPGYKLSNHDEVTCLADGKWSVVPACKVVKCHKLRVININNGYLDGENLFVGSKAKLICDLWHKPKGPRYTKCLNSGRWSVDQLDCVPISCPALQQPPDGVFERVSDTVVELVCNENYKVKEPSSLACDGGTWNGSTPLCALEVECPPLHVPFAGSISTNSTEYGTSVHVTCAQGHVISSPYPVHCNMSGQWNASLPSCNHAGCSDITDIKMGVVVTGSTVGDTARLECRSCETWSGNRNSVCVAGGVWDPPIGSCQPVTCSTKVGMINKKLYESVEGDIPTKCGKSVTFICKPGYTTIGRTTVTCYDTGQYDYHVPFCVQSGIFKLRRLRRK